MTLICNVYGGPGSGKSTTAAGVFSKLKKLGVNCEYASEWCKDKVWEGNTKVFKDQLYILGKQHWKLSRLIGEVDVVITDSPLLLSVVYGTEYQSLPALVHEAYNRYHNMNFLLQRTKSFNPKGRNQNEEESINLDIAIRDMLNESLVPYEIVPGSDEGEDKIVNRILEQVGW